MLDPRILCCNHLLGEHREIHDLVRKLKAKMSLDGYVRSNCIEPISIITRHNEIVAEMLRREWPSGIDHKTPIESTFDYERDTSYLPSYVRNAIVDKTLSLEHLTKKECFKCKR